MNKVFNPYLWKFILVFFFYDILVYSRNMEEHIEHLETVLGELQRHSLYANMKKCLFAQTRVKYLGLVVSTDWVVVDQSKVAAMLKWPMPKTLKQLRGS